MSCRCWDGGHFHPTIQPGNSHPLPCCHMTWRMVAPLSNPTRTALPDLSQNGSCLFICMLDVMQQLQKMCKHDCVSCMYGCLARICWLPLRQLPSCCIVYVERNLTNRWSLFSCLEIMLSVIVSYGHCTARWCSQVSTAH